ncbi:helix-turn-helix protein [Cellulomonas sp. SLBN-39]|nr:helix-turn-helix protein [Cellulomonas sp. SLBN-39]
MPIFRSALQARLLLHVLTTPGTSTAADLAHTLGAPETTVSREVRRLLDAGLLRGERVGRAVVLHPATDNPATEPLRQLLVVTYGPAQAVERALTGIAGIDEAYVHGSWAARFHGEPGPPPGDVDVLVVGAPDRAQVDDALDGLDATLGREVNVTYASPSRWADATDPFVQHVRSRPLVGLDVHRRGQVAS